MKFKILAVGYFTTITCLFLYSFTQVDLSLTLSRASLWQSIQKSFQYLGFFQRPTSALIFSIILLLMFLFYGRFLYLAGKNKINKKQAWMLILVTVAILTFSYNAFSYDLFNYIFDAKILTHYNQNPFLHKPLDFPADPMLNFMRWTHRLYPYGPSWLFLTVPLSYIGMNYFLPTLILFKLLIAVCFLGTNYFVYKISETVFPKNSIFNLIFWGLNPLVIIEGLVSSHNDIPMIFFTLFSFYLLIKNKKIYSSFVYLFSVGIKYANIVILPVFLTLLYFKNVKKEINWEKIFIFSIFFSIIAVIIASIRTTFQPWYLLYILSFAALVSKKQYVFISNFILSFFGTAIYIPYVYLSDYDKSYPSMVLSVEITGLIIILLFTFFYILRKVFKNYTCLP